MLNTPKLKGISIREKKDPLRIFLELLILGFRTKINIFFDLN